MFSPSLHSLRASKGWLETCFVSFLLNHLFCWRKRIQCANDGLDVMLAFIFKKKITLLVEYNLSNNLSSFKKKLSTTFSGKNVLKAAVVWRQRCTELTFWKISVPSPLFFFFKADKRQFWKKQLLFKTLFHVFYCEPEKILWKSHFGISMFEKKKETLKTNENRNANPLKSSTEVSHRPQKKLRRPKLQNTKL